MKKNIAVILVALSLTGCATYKFQRGDAPYDKGYVASREGYTILEYTVGKDNSVPNLSLAKARFQRRKNQVEFYYKKMGEIENRFKMTFWDPTLMFLKLITGPFRIPFVVVSDYRVKHNPKYKERLLRIEEQRESFEKARIRALKDKLDYCIKEDLAVEERSSGMVAPLSADTAAAESK